MSLREYIKENELAQKIVDSKNRIRHQQGMLAAAKSRNDAEAIKFWNDAIANGQKNIEKFKTQMTKPKRSDSKAAAEKIDKVETVDGWTHVHYKDGTKDSHSTKKAAIHSLLDKGLSAADVERQGFAGLTVQHAKKSWKNNQALVQTNAVRAENKRKESEGLDKGPAVAVVAKPKGLDDEDKETLKNYLEELADLNKKVEAVKKKIEGLQFRDYIKRTGDVYG